MHVSLFHSLAYIRGMFGATACSRSRVDIQSLVNATELGQGMGSSQVVFVCRQHLGSLDSWSTGVQTTYIGYLFRPTPQRLTHFLNTSSLPVALYIQRRNPFEALPSSREPSSHELLTTSSCRCDTFTFPSQSPVLMAATNHSGQRWPCTQRARCTRGLARLGPSPMSGRRCTRR